MYVDIYTQSPADGASAISMESLYVYKFIAIDVNWLEQDRCRPRATMPRASPAERNEGMLLHESYRNRVSVWVYEWATWLTYAEWGRDQYARESRWISKMAHLRATCGRGASQKPSVSLRKLAASKCRRRRHSWHRVRISLRRCAQNTNTEIRDTCERIARQWYRAPFFSCLALRVQPHRTHRAHLIAGLGRTSPSIRY